MTAELIARIRELEANISSVVLGKEDVIRHCLVTLLAGEHILLEDVPGVGKTLIGKSLAKSIDGRFARIQSTPDLLPADVTGSSIYHAKEQEFQFIPGPIFSNIVLADEINRTTPRTQSSLLEAMGEAQVSADGTTYPLERPFMVIATQNPLEFEGTYPLPESQYDRFLMRISIGYPARHAELKVLTTHREGEPVDHLKPVLTIDQVLELQDAVRTIRVDDSISQYILDIADSTRHCDDLYVGVSTRGALAMYRACQALAMIEGRDFVIPDDVKRLAVPVLSHRVIGKGYQHGAQRRATETLIARLVDDISVPN